MCASMAASTGVLKTPKAVFQLLGISDRETALPHFIREAGMACPRCLQETGNGCTKEKRRCSQPLQHETGLLRMIHQRDFNYFSSLLQFHEKHSQCRKKSGSSAAYIFLFLQFPSVHWAVQTIIFYTAQ